MGEIARAHGTVHLLDMLSNKHTNSEEQRITLLGLFSKVAWKFSLGEGLAKTGLNECFL